MSRDRKKKEGFWDPEEPEDEYEDEEEDEKKFDLKSTLLTLVKDILVAGGIIFVIILIMLIYTQSWPPIVVVESESMMHGDDSAVGVIDTGDMVLVKKIDNKKHRSEITTWAQKDEEHYSSYGNVIIFKRDGSDDLTPIIHRAVLWLEFDYSVQNEYGAAINIPDMDIYGSTGEVIIKDYPDYVLGKGKVDIEINLTNILKNNLRGSPVGGYITKGDHNSMTDQPGMKLIQPDWIIGKAVGELPAYGLIKLWAQGKLDNNNPAPRSSVIGLFVSLGLIIAGIFAIDFLIGKGIEKYKERKGKGGDAYDRGEEDDGDEEDFRKESKKKPSRRKR